MNDRLKGASFKQKETTKIQTKTAEIYWEESNILRMNIMEGADIDLNESKNNLNAFDAISQGNSYSLMLDARTNWNTSKEAREYTAKEESKRDIIGRAILVKSLSSRLFAHFYIKFNHLHSTTRIFNNEEKAIAWLRSRKH